VFAWDLELSTTTRETLKASAEALAQSVGVVVQTAHADRVKPSPTEEKVL
jgi:hypothetical protein